MGLAAQSVDTGPAATIASLIGDRDPGVLLEEAARRFRCISWDVLCKHPELFLTMGGITNQRAPAEVYKLSEPCELSDCDAFLSHGWHDDRAQKWAALTAWCEDFAANTGRALRLWFDLVCINQTN